MRFLLPGLFIALLAAGAARSAELITSVPVVITRPGTYELAANMTYRGTSGSAIRVASDNVVIDLGGFGLFNDGGPATTAFGVEAYDQSNITVRNGALRGFLFGIRFDHGSGRGSFDHTLENLDISSFYYGILARGDGTQVRGCQLLNIGGSTLPGFSRPIALRVSGDGMRIVGNTITNVARPNVAGGEGVGIVIESGIGVRVERNDVSRRGVETLTFGMFVGNAGPTEVLAERNLFVRWNVGVQQGSSARVFARDNTFLGCTTALGGNPPGNGNEIQ